MKPTNQNKIVESIAQLTVKGDSLQALKKIKSLKAQARALEEQARSEQKALLEGLGIEKGANCDIVDGNGRLVATWKTTHKEAYMVKAQDVSRLTIKVS